MNDRLQRVIDLYESAGRIEAIADGGASAATACLERAKERLRGAELLVTDGFFEIAYTTAYDAHRGAAEAVVLLNGYRVTTARGAHEATHEFAAAAINESGSPFDSPTAAPFRGGRNASEYFDPANPAPKTKADAEWAIAQARRACERVSALL